MGKFCDKKYEREIINYYIVELITLSSLSREFHKFFSQLIFAFFLKSFRSLETLLGRNIKTLITSLQIEQ